MSSSNGFKRLSVQISPSCRCHADACPAVRVIVYRDTLVPEADFVYYDPHRMRRIDEATAKQRASAPNLAIPEGYPTEQRMHDTPEECCDDVAMGDEGDGEVGWASEGSHCTDGGLSGWGDDVGVAVVVGGGSASVVGAVDNFAVAVDSTPHSEVEVARRLLREAGVMERFLEGAGLEEMCSFLPGRLAELSACQPFHAKVVDTIDPILIADVVIAMIPIFVKVCSSFDFSPNCASDCSLAIGTRRGLSATWSIGNSGTPPPSQDGVCSNVVLFIQSLISMGCAVSLPGGGGDMRGPCYEASVGLVSTSRSVIRTYITVCGKRYPLVVRLGVCPRR